MWGNGVYRYTVLSKNQLFTFDRYTESNIALSIKVSNQYLPVFRLFLAFKFP